MAVIALASPKGGCGKSTTAITLAGAYAEQGYSVRIIDADPRQRVARWAESGLTGPKIGVVSAKADTIVTTIRAAEKEAQIVIVDVEGSANMVVPLAIAHANFVIIPANPSAADVEDAIATVQIVHDTPSRNGKSVPHGLLWTRVSTGFQSREFVALASQLAEAGVPVIGQLVERTAYKSLFSYCTTLDQLPRDEVPGTDKARAEGAALANAVAEAILNNQEKAA